MAYCLPHGSGPAACGIGSTSDARRFVGLCWVSWLSCVLSILQSFFCVSHAASPKETFGMMLRGDVRRPRPRLFSQLLAGLPSGMPCRALVSKRVQGVQRSGDTAVATAEACCQRKNEPTGATVRNTCAVYVLCQVFDVVGVGFPLLSGCGS